MNDVETMNGSVRRGENQIVIPSTLFSGNEDHNTEEGKKKLRKNMDAATQTYVKRVNGQKHGLSEIRLIKGAKIGYAKLSRSQLLQF